jgi:hypothetical protein
MKREHILCSVTFPRESCVVREIVWKKYGRPRQAADTFMRFTCWITKATDILIICNSYCFSTATVGTRTRLSGTLYVQCYVVKLLVCLCVCSSGHSYPTTTQGECSFFEIYLMKCYLLQVSSVRWACYQILTACEVPAEVSSEGQTSCSALSMLCLYTRFVSHLSTALSVRVC